MVCVSEKTTIELEEVWKKKTVIKILFFLLRLLPEKVVNEGDFRDGVL